MAIGFPRANIGNVALQAPASDASAQVAAANALGAMPEWNLADLYPGPQSKALTGDIDKAGAAARDLRERYQGRLVALVDRRAQEAGMLA